MRSRSIEYRPALVEERFISSMDVLVRTEGLTAAAWLVRKHKSIFHKTGACYFDIKSDDTTPTWFRVAIETLKRRAGWSVRVHYHSDTRRYTVQNMNWGKYG